MRYLGNKRRLAALAVTAALVGVTLWAVLPAVASNAGDYVGPESATATVLPKDVAIGGNGNCSNLFPGLSGVTEYDNSNPKSGSYSSGNQDQVAFKLTLSKGQEKDKYLDFSATGAVVLGVGINGGSESTTYDYTNKDTYTTPSNYKGSVTSDTRLHAPAQSWTGEGSLAHPEQATSLYSISHLTICYTVSSFIEGTVYKDDDQTGTYSSSTDTLVPNTWKVRLYGNGSLITDQTTNTGAYHFDLPVDGTTYSVCEVPGEAPPSGQVWVESQPNPSLPPGTTSCSHSGETAHGYQFKPTSSAGQSGRDFGNVLGYPCADAPVGIDPYTVGECKTNQTYVFNTGTLNPGTPDETPFVDYWVGDPAQGTIPVVELVNFDDPIDPSTGQPKYTTLLFADGGGFPVTLGNLLTMPYCKVDPRANPDSSPPDSFVLDGSYQPSDVLPGVYPDANTSCVISIKVTAGPDNTGTLQAYVYALGDSIRSVG